MTMSRLAFALLAAFFTLRAQADYTVDYISAHCDPAERKLEVHAASIEDEDEQWQSEEERRVAPYHNVSAPDFVLTGDGNHSTEGTCIWTDGTRVLVHFGQRSGEEGMWISVWVNTSKWLGPEIANKEFPGYEPGEARSVKSVAVTPDGMNVCSIGMKKAGFGSSAFQGDDDLSFGPEKCEAIAWALLDKRSDPIEFPGGKQRPSPYTEIVRQSRNDRLCYSLLNRHEQPLLNVGGGSGIWLYSSPPLNRIYGDQVPEEANDKASVLPPFLRPIAFDVENSGQVQTIIPISNGSHAEDNDRLYVYSAAGLKKLGASPNPMQGLERFSRYVIPWVWLRCSGQESSTSTTANLEMCREDSALPFVTTNYDGQPVSFRSRYLHIDPIVYEGATYLILTTIDQDRDNIAFVVKPLKKGRYEQTCTLEAIRPNF